MTRKCKICGEVFEPPQKRECNAMKYCSPQCQAIAYNQLRQKARTKYNQNHNRSRARIILCEWCAQPFITTHNRKYCSLYCRKEARREQNKKHQQHYRVMHGKSEKEKYYSNLGTSNLREHPKKNFQDEKRLIKFEKRRRGI